jgi:hypothetical protein
MKRSKKSTAITEAEYHEFFDENITVKRRRELKEKIGRRVDSLNWNLFEITDTDFDLEYLEQQSPEKEFECCECMIYFQLETEMSTVEEFLKVKFLWDDEYLGSKIKEIEEHNKAEVEAQRKRDLTIEKAVSVLAGLSKNDQNFFIDQDMHFFRTVSQKLKDAQKSVKR